MFWNYESLNDIESLWPELGLGHDMRGKKNVFDKMKTPRKPKITRGSWKPGTEFCEDTKRYEDKKDLIRIKHKYFLLRPGYGQISFVPTIVDGNTVVRLYGPRPKKKHLSTHIFSGSLTTKEAGDKIFNHAEHEGIARRYSEKPYKVIYRHGILSKEDFDEKFMPNKFAKSSYKSSAKDLALSSLAKIIEDIDGDEVCAGIFSASLRLANNQIRHNRHTYAGEFPVVEVYAIWSNYDTGSGLVFRKNYDEGLPLQYSYHQFSSKEEMEQCPM